MADVMTVYRPKYKIEGEMIEREGVIHNFKQVTADKLEEYVKVPNQVQRYIAERLVRTETAHFMAEGQLNSYKDIGIERYQFVAALSERTCDECGGLDGEIFDVSDARSGDNYPPIHANCRCTTIMAGAASATRLANDNGENYKIDGDTTFNEWKNSLTDEQKTAMNIDNSGGSGIIKENSKKSITKITDNAIEKVPKVLISGYTDEQCAFIQQQHKDLLRYSRDNNYNNEVAFVLDKELTNRAEFKGYDDKLDFGTSLLGKGSELFVMHNHPRNSSFSMQDIMFLTKSEIKTLTIVKNNGDVEAITKGTEFNLNVMQTELKRLIKKTVKSGDTAEYDKVIEKFLKSAKGGIFYVGN
jgi:SPP1 gp7 family putative phage head morphogenesis protein